MQASQVHPPVAMLMSYVVLGCARLLYRMRNTLEAKGPWSPNSNEYDGALKSNCLPLRRSAGGVPSSGSG